MFAIRSRRAGRQPLGVESELDSWEGPRSGSGASPALREREPAEAAPILIQYDTSHRNQVRLAFPAADTGQLPVPWTRR